MCGIVGYIGTGNAEKIVIEGLKKLEYRGYDSAGIAMNFGGKLAVEKRKGRITNLEEVLENSEYPFDECHLAIGHTRWATHGAPSDINAHPHFSMDRRIAIVHNGIVENYLEIKEKLIKEHGIKFVSETDSEVIAQLLSVYYEGSLEDAMFRAIADMRGAYSICAIAADEPDKIVATRKDAPLLAGIGSGCNFLASDIPALLKHSREFYLIENGEVVVLDKNEIKIYTAEHKSVVRDV
ncbi:MAG: class II glutamine amidotransferase, partial [Firmicutes bacterium]|nr:class II glutamine amidotransferase [Bacillota bacterium]